MKRRALALSVGLLGAATAGLYAQQYVRGRYYTPQSFSDSLAQNLRLGNLTKGQQLYLIGAYDLAQDLGQSCAAGGTTTPTLLEKIYTDYVAAHPEQLNVNQSAASLAAQAYAQYWPCQRQAQPAAPGAEVGNGGANGVSEIPEPENFINFQVTGWFSLNGGGFRGLIYRENVVMPEPYRDNGGHWSLTCERALSQGRYQGTYDRQKNTIRVQGLDLKGKPQTTKCEVFSHDWRAPSR